MRQLVLLLWLALQAQDEKTYDIKFVRPPVIGQRMEESAAGAMSLCMVMRRDGKELERLEGKVEAEFAATTIVAKTDRSGAPLNLSVEFTKAHRTINGKNQPLALCLETIDVARIPGAKVPTLSVRSGRKVPASELAMIREMFALGPDTDPYRPPKPCTLARSGNPARRS